MEVVHHFPPIKGYMARMPLSWWFQPKRMGLVLCLSENGTLIDFLTDSQGEHINKITSARRFKQSLMLGSLYGSSVPVLELPPQENDLQDNVEVANM